MLNAVVRMFARNVLVVRQIMYLVGAKYNIKTLAYSRYVVNSMNLLGHSLRLCGTRGGITVFV